MVSVPFSVLYFGGDGIVLSLFLCPVCWLLGELYNLVADLKENCTFLWISCLSEDSGK